MRGLWNGIAIAAVVTSCMVGIIQTQPTAAKEKPEKEQHVPVTICHSRQPQPSQGGGIGPVNNPYGPKLMTVDDDAIFSEGHSGHDGPVFNNTGQNYWGDIIPPFTTTDGQYFAGMNWDAAGKAIWSNNCQYIAPPVTPPTPETANVHYSVVCDVEKKSAVITFTNSGDVTGSAVLNMETVSVPVNQAVIRTIPTGENGVQITIMIDDKTVYDEKVSCLPGKGDVNPPVVTPSAETPATPAGPKSLPLTGASGWMVTFIASGLAAVTMIVSAVARSLFVKSL